MQRTVPAATLLVVASRACAGAAADCHYVIPQGRMVTREAFKQVAQQAIEQVTVAAEQATGRVLPRAYCFSWLAQKEVVADGDVAEFLTSFGYVDESHIWPCWDLFLEHLRPDGKLLLIGYRAGFAPCPYGEHFDYKSLGHGAGHVGPFKLGCGHIVEQLATERPAG